MSRAFEDAHNHESLGLVVHRSVTRKCLDCGARIPEEDVRAGCDFCEPCDKAWDAVAMLPAKETTPDRVMALLREGTT